MCGYSTHTRFLDYKRFREAADRNNSYLMSDMSHIAGLVAADIPFSNPFDYADIITTTVHKTLRGPRGALIFFKRKIPIDEHLEEKMKKAFYPGNLESSHYNNLAAIATCLREAQSADFKLYQKQVIKNSIALSDTLKSLKFQLMTGGSENHMQLMSLKNKGVLGDEMRYIMGLGNVFLNFSTVKANSHTDRPHALRMGTPAMTTRGCNENDFVKIGHLINKFVKIGKDISQKNESLEDFKKRLTDSKHMEDIDKLKNNVEKFLSKFEKQYSIYTH